MIMSAQHCIHIVYKMDDLVVVVILNVVVININNEWIGSVKEGEGGVYGLDL